MAHPFIRRAPPKTTGREEFGEPFVRRVLALARRFRLSDNDLVASVTAFTAATIADAYERCVLPKLSSRERSTLQIVLGGGGAKNPTLQRMLRDRLGTRQLFTHEDFGIDNGAKEALAFAILAHQTLLGLPSNLPSATGATRPVVLGNITPAGSRVR